MPPNESQSSLRALPAQHPDPNDTKETWDSAGGDPAASGDGPNIHAFCDAVESDFADGPRRR
jgi:hypothetical protein